MRLKAIVFAAAMTATSSLAFAQAPIGSSADFGNGAVLNRGPVPSMGMDMDFRADRSASPSASRPRHVVRHRHRRVANQTR